ncbi:MAG: serpin family protein [Akkermansia sp.]
MKNSPATAEAPKLPPRLRIAFYLLCCAVGLAIGLAVSALRREAPDAAQAGVYAVPEGGVPVDSFSLRLFREALAEQKGSPLTLVAPASVADGLSQLADLSGGSPRQQLEALSMPQQSLANTEPAILTADLDLPFRAEAPPLLRLPLRSQFPTALSMLNQLLPGRIPIGTELISRETRFAVISPAPESPRWSIPFLSGNSVTREFENADGALPPCRLMRARGLFRCAEAADGQWKAIALPLDNGARQGEQALVLILPRSEARRFAEELTPEQLGSIRTALLQAAPRDICVELPRLTIVLPPSSLTPVLNAMGITHIFDIRHAQFDKLVTEPLALNNFVQRRELSFIENREAPGNAPDAAPECISLNRPFLWFQGDWNSAAPPLHMGLLENL